jgi:hypothetical protein
MVIFSLVASRSVECGAATEIAGLAFMMAFSVLFYDGRMTLR